MKILILSPNFKLVFTSEQQKYLESLSAVVYTDPRSFAEVPELSTDEPKILLLDSDFCGWSVTKE